MLKSTMGTPEYFDVIVVGAGVIGSSTACHLAKNGQKTLLLEQVSRIKFEIIAPRTSVLLIKG